MYHKEKRKKISDHLRGEHGQSPVTSYFKEIIYGGIDGIITTFAIVAGFSGAALSHETTTQLTFLVVLLFGLANLLADGVSMGLGNFLSVRSDKSLYCGIRAKEVDELRRDPEAAAKRTMAVLTKRGFSEMDARTLTDVYRKNESHWADFMMDYELEIPDATDDDPYRTGLATFLAFVFFGFIPLLPFIVFAGYKPGVVFALSSCATFIALILLGILKWKVTKASFLKAVFEVVLIGGVAAAVAFFVGSLFSI